MAERDFVQRIVVLDIHVAVYASISIIVHATDARSFILSIVPACKPWDILHRDHHTPRPNQLIHIVPLKT